MKKILFAAVLVLMITYLATAGDRKMIFMGGGSGTSAIEGVITSILGEAFDSEAELTALTSITVTDSVADTETIALPIGYKEYDIYLTQTTASTGAVYLPE